MSSDLWSLDREPVTAADATSQLIEEHGDKFRPRFQEALEEDVPTHPYKVYREIVEEAEELTTEEQAVLKDLKDEYVKKWLEKKRDEVKSDE